MLTVLATVLAVSKAEAQRIGHAQVEIELRPEVVALHRQVRLGDVAYLHTTDLGAIQRLVDLPLGQAPQAGNEAVLERDALARWIRSQVGLTSEQIVWRGSERSRVKGSVQMMPAAQIEQTARAALESWLAARSNRFDIEAMGLRHDLNLPAGRIELRARSLPSASQPSTRMVVWVDVWVDGGFVRTVPVSFLVEAYRDAWVAKSAVAPGAALSTTMLERKEVDVASQPIRPAAAEPPGDLSLRSLRSLKPGDTLNALNTARVATVGRGESVTLYLKAGSMRMESRAESLQEGEMGQVVRVRVAGATSPIEARVVDRGRVEAIR